jgi:hypothetical protein
MIITLQHIAQMVAGQARVTLNKVSEIAVPESGKRRFVVPRPRAFRRSGCSSGAG